MSNEYVIREISNQIDIAPSILRLYLGCLRLSKYVIMSYKHKSHPSWGVDVTPEFVNDFINYISTYKRRSYKEEKIKHIKKKLEELLIWEIHLAMCTTIYTNHKITAWNVGKNLPHLQTKKEQFFNTLEWKWKKKVKPLGFFTRSRDEQRGAIKC